MSALIDGELNDKEFENTKRHLNQCVSCQMTLERMKNVGNQIKTWHVSTSESLDQKVILALKSQKPKEMAVWSSIPRFAFVGVFLLLAIFSGLAFQIGKISGQSIAITVPFQPRVSNIRGINLNETGNRKPIFKTNEAPTVKEKIVTKIVYKTIRIKPKRIRKNSENTAKSRKEKNELNKNELNTNGFRIVSELKPRIIKKGETDED